MASRQGRKQTRKDIAVSDYGARAALALNQCLPGQHRDKLVARMFNCSVRMAQYLRAGNHWTIDRLNQASKAIGPAFDITIASGEQHIFEMQEITERLARLEADFEQVVGRQTTGLAQTEGVKADRAGENSR